MSEETTVMLEKTLKEVENLIEEDSRFLRNLCSCITNEKSDKI